MKMSMCVFVYLFFYVYFHCICICKHQWRWACEPEARCLGWGASISSATPCYSYKPPMLQPHHTANTFGPIHPIPYVSIGTPSLLGHLMLWLTSSSDSKSMLSIRQVPRLTLVKLGVGWGPWLVIHGFPKAKNTQITSQITNILCHLPFKRYQSYCPELTDMKIQASSQLHGIY